MKTSKRMIPVISILALVAVLSTLALTAIIGSTQRQIQNCVSGTSCESVAGTTEDITLTEAASLTPSASVTPTPYQFIDPLAQTATYLVQEATTVQAMILPLMQSVTAVLAGATASAETEIALTPTPNPATRTAIFPTDQALGRTATYSVQGATQTAGVPITLTLVAMLGIPVPNPNIDPLAQTATAIVLGATGTAGAPMTATPLPTSTPTAFSVSDLNAFRAEHINTLVSAAGFTHPIFGDIADRIVKTEADFHQKLDNFTVNVAVTWFAGSKFVVLIVPDEGQVYIGSVHGGNRLYFFRVADGEAHLLDISIEGLTDGRNPLAFNESFLTASNDFGGLLMSGDSFNGFTDLNNNGLPDLAVWEVATGNCCASSLVLLEIRNDGTVVDITPKTADVTPASFVDLGSDGSWEIEGVTKVCTPGVGCYNWLIRWYGWNGSAYVDISANHPELYAHGIAGELEFIDRDGKCLDPRFGLSVYGYLLDYYAMGRLADGWANIRGHYNRDDCTPDQFGQYGKALDDLQAWVEDRLNGIPVEH